LLTLPEKYTTLTWVRVFSGIFDMIIYILISTQGLYVLWQTLHLAELVRKEGAKQSFSAVIGCWTTDHLELNLMLFELQSGKHCEQNKGLKGSPRDCESGHMHHTKNEGSENKWLQRGDIYIGLEEPKRAMPSVQRSAGACWTCDEPGHNTNNCQRPWGNSDPQRDLGQTQQHGTRGPVCTSISQGLSRVV